MVAEAAAAYESLKAATAIARGLQSLHTTTEINQAVIDLQRELLQTQMMVLQLQENAQEMQSRIAELQKMDEEKFEVLEVEFNMHRFTGRHGFKHKESGVFFCPVCFGQKKLTPLQFSVSGARIQQCGGCKTRFGGSDDEPGPTV